MMNKKEYPGERGLVLRQVSRHFSGVRAVDEVSFTLSPGESVALVGPNGAGKSTLIQLISGIEKPTHGQILLNGKRIDRLPPERIARLGLGRSFQTSRVFPALSIWDSVLLGTQAGLLRKPNGRLRNPLHESLGVLLGLRSWRRLVEEQESIARDTLQLFGDRLWPRRDAPAFSLSYANRLWPRRDAPAFSLSYANRRRLEIARVLAGRPDFLLLDEPAAGMNPTETGELTELLLALRRQQPELGILVVEHKLSLVRRVADRVIVLNQGRMLAEGKPDEALDHPEVVEAYLGTRRLRPTASDAHLG